MNKKEMVKSILDKGILISPNLLDSLNDSTLNSIIAGGNGKGRKIVLDAVPRPRKSTRQNSPEPTIGTETNQKESQNRTSFAYTVMSLDEKTCLGCVYIQPTEKQLFDAEVIMWVRASHVDKLDNTLYQAVKTWLREKWPFKNPGYPGRTIGWDEWQRTE